ncbi:urea ABC transporter substrate-binding protein [bacterium]|nr:MAG: urea ABC transporter substrate-binding protein [bacterium]
MKGQIEQRRIDNPRLSIKGNSLSTLRLIQHKFFGALISLRLFLLIVILSIFLWVFPDYIFSLDAKSGPEPIKVGVLYSLTGTMAISEKPLVHAIDLAIKEINDDGGILGRPLKAVVKDGESDWPTFAKKAEKLINEDQVSSIFGCWTSASRKEVLPVIERNDHLLWYVVQYEGQEKSKNVIYGGAAPNQQIIPALDWLVSSLNRKRPFLVGSDYIFPKAANKIIKDYLAIRDIKPVGEIYHRLGDQNFTNTVKAIKDSNANCVLNTINGDSNIGFFAALSEAQLGSDVVPVISFSIAEHEIRSIGTRFTTGHYAAWNYFQSIKSDTNQLFVNAFKNAFGSDSVTDDPIETAYSMVYLFSRAVAFAGSSDPRAIRSAAMGLELEAPGGVIRIDPSNQHTWKIASVGKIRSDGQFQIIWSSPGPIKPDPDPDLKAKPTFRPSEPKDAWTGLDARGYISLDEVRKGLFDQDWSIRLQASEKMAKIGESAIPILEDCLQNASHMVRSTALRSLGQMGAKARNSITHITPLLQDSNVIVREQALRSLFQISEPSQDLLQLIAPLVTDKDPIVRRLAVNTLCKLAPRSPKSLPNLVFSMGVVGQSSINKIADVIIEIVSLPEDKIDSSCIAPLSDILRRHKNDIPDTQLNIIRSTISHIQKRSSKTLSEQIGQSFRNPWIFCPTIYILLLLFTWQVILRFFPLLIHKLNLVIGPYTKIRLPNWLGGSRLPLDKLLVVGIFRYHRRVLDAWIRAHLDVARTNFERKDTVALRKIYVPSPVEINETQYPAATPDLLHRIITSRWCILIHGEGGSGKTALACQIARWGMEPNPKSRIIQAHPMLPVLFESGDVPEELENTDVFIDTVSGQLRALIEATKKLEIEFVRSLLEQGRLLVIADDVIVNPKTSDFPATALIVTSRERQTLGNVPKIDIVPQRIHPEYLLNFIDSYLTAKGLRHLFPDASFFDAWRRLSAIVKDRRITALLAKMYAELLIASKTSETPIKFKDIPELMICYLKDLNRKRGENWLPDDEVRTYLQKIARLSLNQDYRLASVTRDRLHAASPSHDVMNSILDYLESRLQIIRFLDPEKLRFSFTIEPLGEYLAAMAVVRELADAYKGWETVLNRISTQPDNSFIYALWDCVLSQGRDAGCPEWVAARLNELIPKDAVVVSSECIKIGVIHSLSGTMSISEKSLVDAVQLAVDEINEQGGLLNKHLVTIVEDGASDPGTFARKAERLILEEKVCALFGCWTSASRKAVRRVVEENDHLLFYPLQYEGFESSKNIIYTGASPNQQIIPAVQWCVKELGRTRPFLIGSDYVFPKTANMIIKALLPALGGKCVGEIYRPLGDRNFEDVVRQVHDEKADVIFNTINGDSNIWFFRALKDAGVRPDAIPVISFSIAEDELKDMGPELTVGHYCAWNYFQSVDSEENRRFVKAFKAKFGPGRVTDDPIEAAYFGIHVFAKAVRKAQSTDPRAIREACRGLEFLAPGGLITIDPHNQHTWTIALIGCIRQDGQFDIVWKSPEIIRPDPYPVGDCENRGAHSHNRQDELSLGFGRNQYGFWLWGFNKSCLGW